ncbi:MAG: response regulator transcription factor [Chthoniobacteraceae bacterium]
MEEKIVVAGDDPHMIRQITATLSSEGFTVIRIFDGPSVLEAAQEMPQLIVLDLALPGMSGLDVCRALKANLKTVDIPIVMISERTEEIDRIVGFELGVDDYVCKPFSPRELVLRIRSILHRLSRADPCRRYLLVNDVVMDWERLEVTVGGKPIHLTTTEFKLLRVLLERRGYVQSRAALLNDVWGYNVHTDTRTVDTHIRRIREKLGPSGECIKTIRRLGYRIPK